MSRSIFHLSFPITSLAASIEFYCARLGGTLGRTEATWVDVIWFGHQLTLHEQPSQVFPPAKRGVRHFGAILEWNEWEAVRQRILSDDSELEAHIQQRQQGEPEEHVKLLLEDPDGHLIELKAYKNLATVARALMSRVQA